MEKAKIWFPWVAISLCFITMILLGIPGAKAYEEVHVWEKREVGQTTRYRMEGAEGSNYQVGWRTFTGYPSRSFNASTGIVTHNGTLQSISGSETRQDVYEQRDDLYYQYSNGVNVNGEWSQEYVTKVVPYQVESAGPLVEYVTGSIREEHPYNGKDIDGFWYVYKGLSTPPAVYVDGMNKIVGSGGNLVISGRVADGEGDTVTISATVDGVTKHTIISGAYSLTTWQLVWSANEVSEGTYTNIGVSVVESK